MKRLLFTIALLTAAATHSLAQSGDSFTINMTPKAETGKTWDMVLTIDLNESLRDGLALELPVNMDGVPVSVRLGNENMWLKQSEESPTLDQTLTWFKDDSGRVILRFTENRLNAGDQLVVQCAAQMKQQPAQEARVALKRLDRVGQNVRTSDQELDNRLLPITQETN